MEGQPSQRNQEAGVCQGGESRVTVRRCKREGCANLLAGRQRDYCCGACRQAAYRKSPAHEANLAKMANRRALRRLRHWRERNRERSYGFDARYGGTVAKGIPRTVPERLPELTEAGLETVKSMRMGSYNPQYGRKKQ